MRKFVFAPDTHVGYEKKHGKLVPLHDSKAINAMLKFAQDFKPDIYIAGGDNLDCGPVSHWLKHKKSSIADLDLRKDCKEYTKLVLNPINKIMNRDGTSKIWMIGNHEMWLHDAIEENPGLKGVLDVRSLLDLDGWTVKEQGEHVKLGHLHFIHGDTLGNVKNIAAQAVDKYNCSIAFGHFHTHQQYIKHTMITEKPMIGSAIPGLCRVNPNYAMNRPNQWAQGFGFGYVRDNGDFTLYVPIIVGGCFSAEGKVYRG